MKKTLLTLLLLFCASANADRKIIYQGAEMIKVLDSMIKLKNSNENVTLGGTVENLNSLLLTGYVTHAVGFESSKAMGTCYAWLFSAKNTKIKVYFEAKEDAQRLYPLSLIHI